MLTGIGLKLSVLVAEDDVINQKVILLMLKKLGHHADVVANGIEVLQALERHYDVVLMDIGMPEMDGLQATKYIRIIGQPESNRVSLLLLPMQSKAIEKCALKLAWMISLANLCG